MTTQQSPKQDPKPQTIYPWNSQHYGHAENPLGPAYEVSILNKAAETGQVFVDVCPADGHHIDDGLSTAVEISTHPVTKEVTPVVRVFRGDTLIVSVFIDGALDRNLVMLNGAEIAEGNLRMLAE